MAETPLVSVIMNCYNGARYLQETLDSVLAQGYPNWEIVFWDNQSTDGSAEIARGLGDPRIRYFRAPTHTVLYEARNYAIGHAKGELLAFLDTDDTWVPDKLEAQLPAFEDESVGMSCGRYWIRNEATGRRWLMPRGRLPTGDVLDEVLGSYDVGLLTLMIRRSALDGLDHVCDPRFRIIGDLDLVVRLALDWRMAAVDRPLGTFRLHEANESRDRATFVEEVRTWMIDMESVTRIRESWGWPRLGEGIDYLEGLEAVLQGDRRGALAALRRLPPGRRKLRLLAALALPRLLAVRIKAAR